MRKQYLTPLFLFFFSLTQAQEAKLDVNNPYPRINDEIEITFNLSTDVNSNDDASGSIKIYKKFTKKGTYVIGPFSFNINGVVYTSNKITLDIDDALPNQSNGVWIRQVRYNDKDLLIIEQRIPGKWVTETNTPNSISTNFVTESDLFAEIDTETLDGSELDLRFMFSSSHSQDVGNKETANYKISIYRIEKGPNFKEQFYLNKNNFKDFPSNVTFKSFIIK